MVVEERGVTWENKIMMKRTGSGKERQSTIFTIRHVIDIEINFHRIKF